MMFNRKGLLICFTGIDGAGKTTLARTIAKSMNRKGVKSVYVYNRFTPFFMRIVFAIGRLLFLRKKDMFKDYKTYSSARKQVFRNPAVLLFYSWMVFFEYSIQVVFKTIARLAIGRVLICDRYIYDTVINDIAVDFGYSNENLSKALNWYFRFFPKPDLAFLVDIPEEVAMQRKNDIPSIEFIRLRRKYYLSIANQFPLLKLDGLKAFNSLKMRVESEIGSLLNCKTRGHEI